MGEPLLSQARRIWGDQRLDLQQIAVRLMVVAGDIARQARAEDEGHPVHGAEVEKELGNLLLYVGKVLLDSKHKSGTLVMRASPLEDGGWEWSF